MGRSTAKHAFNQLAEAYLIASNRSNEAQAFVASLQVDHAYALDDYFFNYNRRDHSKKALKNDLKGGFK